MSSDGNDDEGMWRAFAGDESRPTRVSVRAEIGIGQVWAVKHYVRRKGGDDALFCVHYRDVFRRQHIVHAWATGRLKYPFGKSVGNEAVYLLPALSLGPQLSHLQVSWKKCACSLRIHALRILAVGQRVLHYRRKAVLTLTNLDVARFLEDVHRCLCRYRGRAGAERQSYLLLSVYERCLLVSRRLRRLGHSARAQKNMD